MPLAEFVAELANQQLNPSVRDACPGILGFYYRDPWALCFLCLSLYQRVCLGFLHVHSLDPCLFHDQHCPSHGLDIRYSVLVLDPIPVPSWVLYLLCLERNSGSVREVCSR